MSFFGIENQVGIVDNAILEGNAWVVSVNMASPKRQAKTVHIAADSGKVLCYYASNRNQTAFP